jgi:hypothetical protein
MSLLLFLWLIFDSVHLMICSLVVSRVPTRGRFAMRRTFVWTALSLLLVVQSLQAGDLRDSLKKGTPDLKSAGPLAFGPEGILFVGDTAGAAIFAVDTGDRTPSASAGTIKIEGIDEKIAGMLGSTAKDTPIHDVAVNPASGKVYLATARGRGPDATPVLFRLDAAGKIEEFSLADVPFAKATLPSAPAAGAQQKGQNLRAESITDLAFVDGRLFVAGLSNEEFASRLLAIPFPFGKSGDSTSVEIYHGAHGRFETRAPVRTFVPFDIKGEPHLLAAYTCTPLVKFPISNLKPGQHVKGTTVAELGNRNRPLDMVVYQKGGKDFLLLANSSRGVMKIATDTAATQEGITQPVTGGGRKGLPYETIESLKNVQQLDRLDKDHAIVLVRADSGSLNLETVALP